MLCILAVFLPSFLMEGAARGLFVPLASAVGFAMIFAFMLSITFVPVLSVWLLRHGHADHAGQIEADARAIRCCCSDLATRWTGPALDLMPASSDSAFAARSRGDITAVRNVHLCAAPGPLRCCPASAAQLSLGRDPVLHAVGALCVVVRRVAGRPRDCARRSIPASSSCASALRPGRAWKSAKSSPARRSTSSRMSSVPENVDSPSPMSASRHRPTPSTHLSLDRRHDQAVVRVALQHDSGVRVDDVKDHCAKSCPRD